MNVRKISVEQTWPIRNKILRPGLPLASCQFEEDCLSSATHFGCFLADEMTGIVSVYQISPADPECQRGWQLRAMATLEEVRGQGHGAALIQAMERHLYSQQAQLAWCNARDSAVGFYQKLGYQITGKAFDVSGVGPHLQMEKRLVSGGE